jgi:hypothetical protein
MISDTGFDEDFLFTEVNQQATQREFCKIIFVGRVLFAPQFFGNHAKKRAPVAMKISG